MKNNTVIALLLLLVATAGISAEQTKLADAMQKASEIMRTGQGSLTQEESALLAAAGISYTKETVQNIAPKVTNQEIVSKNDTLTDHDLVIGKFFLNLFSKMFDK